MKNIDKSYAIMLETLLDVSNARATCDSQTAIYALRYIQELNDKLSRRNMQKKLARENFKQIKDLKTENAYLKQLCKNMDDRKNN